MNLYWVRKAKQHGVTIGSASASMINEVVMEDSPAPTEINRIKPLLASEDSSDRKWNSQSSEQEGEFPPMRRRKLLKVEAASLEELAESVEESKEKGRDSDRQLASLQSLELAEIG